MRIAGAVGVGVMAAVGGDPVDDIALEAERAGEGERDAQRGCGRIAAVGEAAVEADGDAQTADDVEDGQEDEVGESDDAAPEEGIPTARPTNGATTMMPVTVTYIRRPLLGGDSVPSSGNGEVPS